LTYAQAAKLTWPQLMHALGVEANVDAGAEAARQLADRQDAIFDEILIRRECLRVDLLRMPTGDLMVEVATESNGQMPTRESLLDGLRRYVSKSADH
jgi:hypothetical protein